MQRGTDEDMGKRKSNGRKRVQKDAVMITLVNGSTIETQRNVSKVRGGRVKHYIPCQECYDFVWLAVKSKEFEKGLCPKCYRDVRIKEAMENVIKRNGGALKRLAESDGE
jgi:hypothetical protein